MTHARFLTSGMNSTLAQNVPSKFSNGYKGAPRRGYHWLPPVEHSQRQDLLSAISKGWSILAASGRTSATNAAEVSHHGKEEGEIGVRGDAQ